MSPLDDVTLELNFYQDYLNGTINNQLGNRLATTGSTKIHKARVSRSIIIYLTITVYSNCILFLGE